MTGAGQGGDPGATSQLPASGPGLQDETVLHQRRELQNMARGFRQAQVLLTCAELGVFGALEGQEASAPDLAAALGADARGMTLLLNAAAALGFLAKRAERFALTPPAVACLTPDGVGSLVRSMRLEAAFYRRWGHLAEAVRTGKRPEENRADERSEDWVPGFVYALHEMARPVAPLVAEALALPQERALRVLDVGGGHGAYSLALARRYPRLRATVFELPRVVPVAREIISSAGLEDRVMVQAGDFQRQPLPNGYDLVLVFGVLNGEPAAGRPKLIGKAYKALVPGGQIVLRDLVLDSDRAGPPEAAIFALQMLLATDAGGLDTRDDWARWLAEAGFTPPRTLQLPDAPGSTLTLARKPIHGTTEEGLLTHE